MLLLLFSGLIYLVSIYRNRLPLESQWIDLIGLGKWNFYIYFILGNRIRKHFLKFEKLLDNSQLVLVSIFIFITYNIAINFHQRYIFFDLFTALSGIIIVFAYFRKHAHLFSSQRSLGIALQYIGRRTLDIYLLHYFVVFSNLNQYLGNFSITKEPFSELLISIILSIPIIAFCLFISSVLRLSPVLAHYLFGEKKEHLTSAKI